MKFLVKIVGIVLLMCAVSTLVLPPSPVSAQSAKTAEQWYKDGDDQYNLGNFLGAVEAFKKAFETETDGAKKPTYLYNIAQAYRLAKDCKNSLFFYKRFKALRENDTVKPLKPAVRAELDGRIAELEVCVKTQDDAASKQPDGTLRPDSGRPEVTKPDPTKPPSPKLGATDVKVDPAATTTVPSATTPGDGEAEQDGEDGGTVPETMGPTQHAVIRAGGGGGLPFIAGTSSKQGVTLGLTGGYLLPLAAPVDIEVGAGVAFCTIKFPTSAGERDAKLFSGFAFAAVSKHLVAGLSARAELGLGIQLFSGLRAGNPFTLGSQDTSGALSMFVARASASVDYAVSSNISLWLSPATFSYSPTSKDIFRPQVISRLDFLAGVRVGL
jgi:tetratricopeptide (TPR) repeat protein